MKKTLISAMLLTLFMGSASASSIGYSNGTIDKLNCFRVGTSTKQGQAIRLSHAKLQALKGKTIDYAEFCVGSRNTTDKKMHVFISTSLDGTPIAEGDIDITRALSNIKWTLDKPYTVTGKEPCLYIGYTADIATSSKMLLSDGSFDINGCNYALDDGKWVDTYGLNKGSACISINVDGVGDYTDVVMGRSNFDGYFKAKGQYEWTARFVNIGTTAITSFDAVIKVGDNTTTKHFEGLNIAPKGKYSFTLNDISAESEGERNVNVEITNINGVNDELDTSDNTLSASVYFYPQDMERSLLVEGFTGQDCTACPDGHNTIANAIKLYGESVVELSHHAGYYPDIFTMQEDADCLFFYGNPTSTSAPAVMVNRYADNSVSQFPVQESFSLAKLCTVMQHASEKKPYVSLDLETQLNKDTRELKVKLRVKPHTALPSDKILYNLYLVQNDIKAYQASGGSAYNHSSVSRGSLTGNSWGVQLTNLTPGEVKETEEITVTIPEKIHSSYWTDEMISNGKYVWRTKELTLDQPNIEAVLSNMSVVAYVGEYDTSDNSKNYVYNCCEAKLGESYKQKGFGETGTGIENVENKPEADVYADNGRVLVAGQYDKLLVYSISGKQMNADNALDKGVYIVKVISGGKQTTKKILVK